MPLTQGIHLMKAVSVGSLPEDIMVILVLLMGITVVCSAIAVKSFRWE